MTEIIGTVKQNDVWQCSAWRNKSSVVVQKSTYIFAFECFFNGANKLSDGVEYEHLKWVKVQLIVAHGSSYVCRKKPRAT